jgi:hypothetical protein
VTLPDGITALPQNRRPTGRRDDFGRFSPGISGNPGGRPKGIATRIRAETRNGEELADFMLSVLRDDSEPTRTRMEAASWLADRGFGKPTMRQELSGPDSGPISSKHTVGEDDVDRAIAVILTQFGAGNVAGAPSQAG